MAHRSRAAQESAHAHKTSNAKDFAFVAHRMKGGYDQRAVGHKARQSGISGFESAHAHKSQHTGVGTRTQDRKYLDM
jgi:hypothetical protein